MHREQVEAICEAYEAPLSMADDPLVWNITKQHAARQGALPNGAAGAFAGGVC